MDERLEWLTGFTRTRYLMKRSHAFLPGRKRTLCKTRFRDEAWFPAQPGQAKCVMCWRRAWRVGLEETPPPDTT